MVLIREATQTDRDPIHALHMDTFDQEEAKSVAELATNLLSEESQPKIISMVADIDGAVVGHVAYSPVFFNSHENLKGYILAPLGVKPDFQKKHIGSTLIKNGIEQLSQQGVNILFVYGDPKYYGKFGFNSKTSEKFTPPYKLEQSFGWLALALNEKGTVTQNIAFSCVTSLSDPSLW